MDIGHVHHVLPCLHACLHIYMQLIVTNSIMVYFPIRARDRGKALGVGVGIPHYM